VSDRRLPFIVSDIIVIKVCKYFMCIYLINYLWKPIDGYVREPVHVAMFYMRKFINTEKINKLILYAGLCHYVCALNQVAFTAN